MKSITDILQMVEMHTGLDLRKQSKKRVYVYSRWVYFKLSKDLTPYSLREIGELVGQDHSTVIHGLCEWDKIIFYEPQMEKAYNQLRSEIL